MPSYHVLPSPFLRSRWLGLAFGLIALLALPRTGHGEILTIEGDVAGEVASHRLAPEEVLADVALAYRLGYAEVVTANQDVDPWLPPSDMTVILPTAFVLPKAPRKGIVINVAEQRLYYFPPNGKDVVQTFAVGTSQPGRETPRGETTIVAKRANPTWYPTPSIRAENPDLPAVVPPGPDNPLGRHALYTGWHAILIHGTNDPMAIGRRATHGCIRLYPEDIEYLFKEIPPGTPVTVVDQPIKFGWSNGMLYLEVHPAKEDLERLETSLPIRPETAPQLRELVTIAAGDKAGQVDWALVEEMARRRDGIPRRITGVATTLRVVPANDSDRMETPSAPILLWDPPEQQDLSARDAPPRSVWEPAGTTVATSE